MVEKDEEIKTVDPVDVAKEFFDIVERVPEKYYDHDRVTLAKQSYDIFKMNELEDEMKKVVYLCGLQRTPSFLPGLEPMDIWSWALENFLKPFPFMDDGAFNFYKERAEGEIHPLAKARYYYAICCWDESKRGELLGKMGELFIQTGIDAMENKVERLDSIAVAREVNLGITILKKASLIKEAYEQIERILTQIKEKTSSLDLTSLIPFVDAISGYLDSAPKDLVIATAEAVMGLADKAEGRWKENGFEAIIKWNREYLSEIHKLSHSKICEYYIEEANEKEPLVAHHFLQKAAEHGIKAGKHELAGSLLAKAEEMIKNIDIPPTIMGFKIPREEYEKFYTSFAGDSRGVELLLRLSLYAIGDVENVEEEIPAPISMKLLRTSRIQGQTVVSSQEEYVDESLVYSMKFKGALASQSFWGGVNFYSSKDWANSEDFVKAFSSLGFLGTSPFVYEAELANGLGMKHSALHIIVPATERFCHEILAMENQPSTYVDEEGTQVYMLSSLLSKLNEVGIISETEKKFLLIQLDKDGRNIRNAVCHGLIDYHYNADFDYKLCLMLLTYLLAKWYVFKTSEIDNTEKQDEEKSES
jgi:hypothetical protein